MVIGVEMEIDIIEITDHLIEIETGTDHLIEIETGIDIMTGQGGEVLADHQSDQIDGLQAVAPDPGLDHRPFVEEADPLLATYIIMLKVLVATEVTLIMSLAKYQSPQRKKLPSSWL